ncbi:MAG: RNA 2',3'-cyclic phosphodiesterase [Candidatus Nanohalobium sp.]
MARIFSAIDIEDEETLEKLEHIRDTLDLGFKPVNKEKMHITLQFFQDLDEEEIQKVEEGLQNIDVEPFNAKIAELGAFPSEDYIRVIWAGIEHPKIYEIQEKASKHDVESDDHHEFKPHITLLRVENMSRKQKKKVKKTIDEYRDTEIGEIKIDKVKLFKSEHRNGKTEYTEIAEKKL